MGKKAGFLKQSEWKSNHLIDIWLTLQTALTFIVFFIGNDCEYFKQQKASNSKSYAFAAITTLNYVDFILIRKQIGQKYVDAEWIWENVGMSKKNSKFRAFFILHVCEVYCSYLMMARVIILTTHIWIFPMKWKFIQLYRCTD